MSTLIISSLTFASQQIVIYCGIPILIVGTLGEFLLIIVFLIIWLLCSIPYLIFFNQIHSISTETVTCTSTNNIFTQYRIYFATPFVSGFLPLFIAAIFGIMAYRSVQSIAYRTVP